MKELGKEVDVLAKSISLIKVQSQPTSFPVFHHLNTDLQSTFLHGLLALFYEIHPCNESSKYVSLSALLFNYTIQYIFKDTQS